MTETVFVLGDTKVVVKSVQELITEVQDLRKQVAELRNIVSGSAEVSECIEVRESDIETDPPWHIPFPLTRRVNWDDDDLPTERIGVPGPLEWTPGGYNED